MKIDFLSEKSKHRASQGIKHQLIAKAVGIKPNYRPTVIDATAGLGQDAYVLASLGCNVLMIERVPEIADAIEQALKELKQVETDIQLELIKADAKTYLSSLTQYPDVIYLDPMFPERQKSALVKKPIRDLKTLTGDDEDAPALLEIALKKATKRVVVKRPKLASSLKGPEPSHIYKGKSTRFDVYFTRTVPPDVKGPLE